MALDPRPRRAQDERPTQLLAHLYLADPESDDGREALAIVHQRGGPVEFECGALLAKGATEQERIVGADILAQLGWCERNHHEESVSILLELLQDPSEGVVYAAAIALGHRQDKRAITPLVGLHAHPNPDVRYAVVHGLSGHDNLSAVAALVQLAADEDRDVRNWATFGLACQTDLDSPEIREALLRSAGDHDSEIRGEALVGLALRGDSRGLPLVRMELCGEFHGDWAVEAAELFADPALHPLLEALQRRLEPEDHLHFESSFADALEACQPER